MKNKIDVLGIGVSSLTSTELNDEILNIVEHNGKELVLNVNIHCINLAYCLSWLRDLLNSTRIVFCDGDGVRLGAKILGKKIKEKITYNRWIWEFAAFSEKHGLTWYLIGSTDLTIEEAARKFKKDFPGLKLQGYRNGYFLNEGDIREAIEDINSKSVNVVILGMGMPVQEKWLLNNWNNVGANVALTGGAVFDYVSGKTKMTPDLMYKLKLEWLYRFMLEPKRLFKRYFLGNPTFFRRLLTTMIKDKFGFFKRNKNR